MEVDAWIQERIARHGSETLDGVRRACAIASDAGGDVFIPSTRGSIIASWPSDDGKLVYPIGVYPSAMVVLRLGYLKYRPAFAAEDGRRELYDELSSIVGGLHTQSLAGEPGFLADKLTDDALAHRFAEFLGRVVALGKLADAELDRDLVRGQ